MVQKEPAGLGGSKMQFEQDYVTIIKPVQTAIRAELTSFLVPRPIEGQPVNVKAFPVLFL